MKRLLNLALVALLVGLWACGGGDNDVDPGDQPPPPPEPTAEEIAGKFRSALGPIEQEVTATGTLSTTVKEQALAQLRQVENEYRGKQHLPEAKASVASEVAMRLDQALRMAKEDQSQNSGLWTAVSGIADVLQVLDPANPKIERAKQDAIREINRPRVVGVPSFFSHDGDLIVFIDVMFPETGQVEHCKVREGEEFANGRMRLKEVIGNNQGVVISYTDDGKSIELRRR